MSSSANGVIEATGITPRTDFKAAASVSPARPFMTFPVKPESAKEIINKFDQVKNRTDDSKTTSEPTVDGGTRFSFIDKRDNQPLAVMNVQGGGATITLYKSPESLANRIDSNFISAKDIRDFIQSSQIATPQLASGMKP